MQQVYDKGRKGICIQTNTQISFPEVQQFLAEEQLRTVR